MGAKGYRCVPLRRVAAKLLSDCAHGLNLGRITDGVVDSKELLVCVWPSHRLCVVESGPYNVSRASGRVALENNQGSIWIPVRVEAKVDKRLEVLIGGRCRIGNDASPKVLVFEGLHIVSRHNTKVAVTTLQCGEEVSVRSLVSIDDTARGKNDLEV